MDFFFSKWNIFVCLENWRNRRKSVIFECLENCLMNFFFFKEKPFQVDLNWSRVVNNGNTSGWFQQISNWTIETTSTIVATIDRTVISASSENWTNDSTTADIFSSCSKSAQKKRLKNLNKQGHKTTKRKSPTGNHSNYFYRVKTTANWETDSIYCENKIVFWIQWIKRNCLLVFFNYVTSFFS